MQYIKPQGGLHGHHQLSGISQEYPFLSVEYGQVQFEVLQLAKSYSGFSSSRFPLFFPASSFFRR
jgi:hypothetical protein